MNLINLTTDHFSKHYQALVGYHSSAPSKKSLLYRFAAFYEALALFKYPNAERSQHSKTLCATPIILFSLLETP